MKVTARGKHRYTIRAKLEGAVGRVVEWDFDDKAWEARKFWRKMVAAGRTPDTDDAVNTATMFANRQVVDLWSAPA